MAEPTTKPKGSEQDPSMEEILQSIRRIIAEESDEPAEADKSPPPAAPVIPAIAEPAEIPAPALPAESAASKPAKSLIAAPAGDAPPPLSQAGIEPTPPSPEPVPEPKPQPVVSNVLELTDVIQDDGSVISLKKQKLMDDEQSAEAEPAPSPPPASGSDMDILQNIDHVLSREPEPLLSSEAADAARKAMEKLYAPSHVEEPPAAITPAAKPAVMEQGALEGLVISALRPMLREWLDKNLPSIVEKVVEREIRSLSAQPPKK